MSNPLPNPFLGLCLKCLPSSLLGLVLQKLSTDMTSSRKPSLTHLNNQPVISSSGLVINLHIPPLHRTYYSNIVCV
jgi:hypothetical protein